MIEKNYIEKNDKIAKCKKRLKHLKIYIIILLIIVTSILTYVIYINKCKEKILGYIYFNKPVSWEKAYAKIYKDNKEEYNILELKQEEDYIYSLELTNKIVKNADNISDYKIIFNSGEDRKYQISTRCEDYNKIYNITTGLGTASSFSMGEWIDYNKDIKMGKIPQTTEGIKNVIFMIGDGMGENHILATELYKGDKLNIQSINNKSYVKTESTSEITDSAASATALATGCKTNNGVIGKDTSGNDVENIIEFAKSKGLKTGIVCTQILNHATPAGFAIHNKSRNNYDEITIEEINSNIDIMLGGGRKYFSKHENLMKDNNYKWVNNMIELKNTGNNEKILGTFAEDTISEEKGRVSLSDLSYEALSKLDNEQGFFLMIEGSDIDKYAHKSDMSKMITEIIDFDDAVKVAKTFVDENPDTLLIVTADHETGGLTLDGVYSKDQLNNNLFKREGQHTNFNVLVYAYGKESNKLTQYDIIDNTSIYSFVKQAITNK